MDPKIQALGCMREQVKKMLANVGFTSDGKAKPDHTSSTPMDRCCMKTTLARAMLQRACRTPAEKPAPQTRPRSDSQDAYAPDKAPCLHFIAKISSQTRTSSHYRLPCLMNWS